MAPQRRNCSHRRQVDVDCAPATHLLAQAAAHASPLIHNGHAEEVVHDTVVLTQAEGVKRADLDAQLAAPADAVVLDDNGPGPPAEPKAAATRLVQDRLTRADHAAGAAVHAQRRVDDVDIAVDAGNGASRAAPHAPGAAVAGFHDGVGQGASLPRSRASVVVLVACFIRRPAQWRIRISTYCRAAGMPLLKALAEALWLLVGGGFLA